MTIQGSEKLWLAVGELAGLYLRKAGRVKRIAFVDKKGRPRNPKAQRYELTGDSAAYERIQQASDACWKRLCDIQELKDNGQLGH